MSTNCMTSQSVLCEVTLKQVNQETCDELHAIQHKSPYAEKQVYTFDVLVHPTVTILDVLLGLNKWACDNDLLLGSTVDDVYKFIALRVIQTQLTASC